MIEAIDRYIPNPNIKFMQYANASEASRIQGSIVDYLRSMNGLPRKLAPNRRKIKPLMQALHQVLGHKPTNCEFVSHYGEEYRVILEDPLFETGIFNQPTQENFNSDVWGQEYFFNDIEDFRHERSMSWKESWNTEDRIAFEDRILSVIKDDKERFAFYAYHFGELTNKEIAAFPMMKNCSASTARSIRMMAERTVRLSFTREEILCMLHKQ